MKYEHQKDLQKETKKRVERMRKEFVKPPLLKAFRNEGYDQIIAQVHIPISSLCEHHLVSFEGEANIAYIPNGWLIGLSKLGRVAEYYLNPSKPTIQERATHQILQHLKTHLKPRGLMVVIRAKHTCISYRGVKKPSLTITSAVDGLFADPLKGARQEFLQLISNQ